MSHPANADELLEIPGNELGTVVADNSGMDLRIDWRQLCFPTVLPHGRMLPGGGARRNTVEDGLESLRDEP